MKNLRKDEEEKGMKLTGVPNGPLEPLLIDDEKAYLDRIGLSTDEIAVYELLLLRKKLTASQIADELGLFTSAVYRLCYGLEAAKLIRVKSARPKLFIALNKANGLAASLQNEEKILAELIGDDSKEDAELIFGRKSVYQAYMRHVERAQRDVRIYSIGIAFNKDLERSQAKLRKRGVAIHHVVQQQKLSNQHVIAHWQRLGIKLRFLSKQRGFHFYLIDTDLVCITFSDPEDTDNRISVVTTNRAAIELFDNQFNALWSQAKEIES